MRWIKPLVLTIVSFLLAVVGDGLVRRAIALVMCGVFGLHATACNVSFALPNSAQATPANQELPASARITRRGTDLAQIPRIRKPSLELPDDFRVVSQVPFSSGERKIQFVSSSTGAEQVYSTSLPDVDQFELFGVEFRKISGLDVRPLLVGRSIQIEPTEVEASLKTFKVQLKNNELSKVVLADGTTAEFTASQVIIKSSRGDELEKILLSSVSTSVNSSLIALPRLKTSQNLKSDESFVIAQANSSSCKTGAKSYLRRSSQQMFQIGEQLVANPSKNSFLIGAALKFSNISLQNNSISKEFIDTVCQAPIKCNEQVVSGGSEIRTDLFQVPQGSDRKVSIEFEFYQVPDRLEMDFDGKRVLSIGPASGRSTQTFSFPDGARYVGVKLTGNQEIKSTKWWYKVACSGELCPDAASISTLPLSGSLNTRNQNLRQENRGGISNGRCPSCETMLIESLPSEAQVSRMKTFAKTTIPLLLRTAKEAGITDPRQIAYILATAQHESFLGRTMTEPESYARAQNYDSNACNFVDGNRVPGNGVKYRGRGFVHLTHKCNYEKWQNRLNTEFKDKFGGQLDLVNNPALAANPEISAVISVYGMRDGSFKSATHRSIHRLETYFNSEREDYIRARDIINNPDKEDKTVLDTIASHARRYADILKNCK